MLVADNPSLHFTSPSPLPCPNPLATLTSDGRQLPCLLVIDITSKSDYPFAIRRKLALSALCMCSQVWQLQEATPLPPSPSSPSLHFLQLVMSDRYGREGGYIG